MTPTRPQRVVSLAVLLIGLGGLGGCLGSRAQVVEPEDETLNTATDGLPEDIEPPKTFGEVAAHLSSEHGCLLVGMRDPSTGRDHLNPATDSPITAGCSLLYVAERPVLPPIEAPIRSRKPSQLTVEADEA